jgi:hypothetical protein
MAQKAGTELLSETGRLAAAVDLPAGQPLGRRPLGEIRRPGQPAQPWTAIPGAYDDTLIR